MRNGLYFPLSISYVHFISAPYISYFLSCVDFYDEFFYLFRLRFFIISLNKIQRGCSDEIIPNLHVPIHNKRQSRISSALGNSRIKVFSSCSFNSFYYINLLLSKIPSDMEMHKLDWLQTLMSNCLWYLMSEDAILLTCIYCKSLVLLFLFKKNYSIFIST